MDQQPPLPADPHKAAEADILGEAACLKPPAAGTAEPVGEAAETAPCQASRLPEPPPADDINQAGFIGERKRPPV